MAFPRRIVRRVIPDPARKWVIDRWLVRWAKIHLRNSRVIAPALRRQLAWRGAPVPSPASGARILVPLIETSHYQYYQILALAKALQLRGAAVRILICDSTLDGCELKNSRRTDWDPCLTCRMNARDLVGLFGLDVVRLSDAVTAEQRRAARARAAEIAAGYPTRFEYKGVNLIGMTNESVTRYYYGDVPAEGTPALEHQRVRSLYSAMVGVDAAEAMHREWAPTALVNSMGVYADWTPYLAYFRQRGVPYDLVTMAPFDLRAVMFNYDELYSGTSRFERWRRSRSSAYLDPSEKAALDAVVAARFSVGGGFEQRFGWFDDGASEVTRAADRTKRNIFLFSNLYWDVGINYEGALFDDVIAWVLKSVEILAGRPDCHLYIKTHPEEAYGSAHSERGVADAIRARFPTLPANVTIIPPQMKVRPYELFPLIDLGVVYNSTIGLEMMLKGITVVAAGAAPYGGHGLSCEPKTVEEYADVLLGCLAPARPDPRLVELFAYFYFIKSQIPWRLTPQVYFDDFKGFTFDRLDDLLPGHDRYLDHLCDCILAPERTVVEAWI